MSVKAELKILLKANEVEIAESDDADLWQRVLLAITGKAALQVPAIEPAAGKGSQPPAMAERPTTTDEPVSSFAAAVGVTVEELGGACGPTMSPPYLTLDMHCWEAMKNQLPNRGRRCLGPIQLAATLLGLWARHAKIGATTQANAQAVLATLNLRDSNAARGMQSAEWLQARSGGAFNINPAQVSRANSIAKAFCKKDWSQYLMEE